MNDIEEALEYARTPGKAPCPICGDEFYAPMDKLCIGLYGHCVVHLEDDSHKSHNLLEISQSI